jgi:hypothetical protein
MMSQPSGWRAIFVDTTKNGEPFIFKRFWCKNSKENTKKGDEKAERGSESFIEKTIVIINIRRRDKKFLNSGPRRGSPVYLLPLV